MENPMIKTLYFHSIADLLETSCNFYILPELLTKLFNFFSFFFIVLSPESVYFCPTLAAALYSNLCIFSDKLNQGILTF